jgi:hypothetical protein
MKLSTKPDTRLEILNESLEMVIEIKEDSIPTVRTCPGKPKPDRHMVLGVVQSLSMAVEERDEESVAFVEPRMVQLHTGEEIVRIDAPLVMMKSSLGKLGALALVDPKSARGLARGAVRYFTGTVRLDIP